MKRRDRRKRVGKGAEGQINRREEGGREGGIRIGRQGN